MDGNTINTHHAEDTRSTQEMTQNEFTVALVVELFQLEDLEAGRQAEVGENQLDQLHIGHDIIAVGRLAVSDAEHRDCHLKRLQGNTLNYMRQSAGVLQFE